MAAGQTNLTQASVIESPSTTELRAGSRTAEIGVSDAVLCVDDDPNILDALRRQFRKMFRIETATGPEEGLAAVRTNGPFAVVISDLRMPGMNGIQFLAAVRAMAPDTVRVILTGQADLADAIAAVNQGAIFRFLLKPSSAIILSKVIESSLEQHRLIIAERQLTEQTLIGCVEVLAEVLSIVEPVAFRRTSRVLRYVRQMASAINLAGSWQVEAAAMLSQIGWITIPGDIAEKIATGKPLSPEESCRFREHPGAAARIIERIPRLQTVAKIIEAQLERQPGLSAVVDARAPADPVFAGTAILQAATDLDERLQAGQTHHDAIDGVRARTDTYPKEVIAALEHIERVAVAEQTKVVPLSRLMPGMILEEDICGRNGICLIGRGQQITSTQLQRLKGFSNTLSPDLEITVRIPDLGRMENLQS